MPVLTIFTLPLLAILFMLGNWQWGRYQFKLAAETKPIAQAINIKEAIISPHEFQKIQLIGNASSKFIKIQTSQGGEMGQRFFTTVETQIGNVIYEYGFVSDKELIERQASQKSNIPKGGAINQIVVLRRAKRPNKFIPDNNIEKFYWPEIPAIEKALNINSIIKDFYFTPINMDPMGDNITKTNPYADEKGATYVEPGRHLGYALTWWGLFISLIAVYLALHIKNGRLNFKSK